MPSKGTPMRHIRIEEELWSAAREKAEAEGRDVSTVVREGLQRYVKRPPRKR